MFKLEDIIISPETSRPSSTVTISGKVTLFGIAFYLPFFFKYTLTGPEEKVYSGMGSAGEFENKITTPETEGDYELKIDLYGGPTYFSDGMAIPPFPAVDTFETTLTISEVAPPECTIDADCPPGYKCVNGKCIKEIPPECTPGETTCKDYDLYTCGSDSKWHLTEKNSETCGYAPPECIPGDTKCVGYDLYTCGGDEKWHLTERNSVECGYVPPDGWQPEGVELGRGNFSVEITEEVIDYYTLSITIVPEGVGVVEPPAGEYPWGQRIDLYAEATDPDYKFLKWGGAASGTDPYTSINMYGDRSVRAEFVKKEIPPEKVSFTIRGIFWPPGAAYWRVTWWYPPYFDRGEQIAYNVPISQNAKAVDQPAYGAPEFTVFDRYPGVGVVPIYRSYDRYGHSGLAFEAKNGVTYRYDFSTETIRE